MSVDRLAVARAAAARPRSQGPVAAGLDAAAVLALVDPVFLAEAGWDADRQVLRPPAEHPLLGRPICRVAECWNSAHNPRQICQGCAQRIAEHGLDEERGLAQPPPRQRNKPRGCAVPGCGREWVSATLCHAHWHQQHNVLRLPVQQFVADVRVHPLPACGPCAVPACTRQRTGPEATYCNAHQQRWWKARQADPGLDEQAWRRDASSATRPGEISLRGLHPLVVAQLLLGFQERTRTGRKHFDAHLRYAVNDIRRQQAVCLTAVDTGRMNSKAQRSLVHSITEHLRRFFVDPETEKDKDIWDLAAFGGTGRVWFTAISQRWLRDAAKRWAVDDLPRRRGTKVGYDLRLRISYLAWLSASLRLRPDAGQIPAVLGRADMENFLHRLAFQQANGQLSADRRRRACLEVRTVLGRVRAMGLTRPGAGRGRARRRLRHHPARHTPPGRAGAGPGSARRDRHPALPAPARVGDPVQRPVPGRGRVAHRHRPAPRRDLHPAVGLPRP